MFSGGDVITARHTFGVVARLVAADLEYLLELEHQGFTFFGVHRRNAHHDAFLVVRRNQV